MIEIHTERERREFWRVVYRVLTPCQQRALLGHVLQRKSYSQIARETGVNRSTVLRTVRLAVQRLRRALED